MGRLSREVGLRDVGISRILFSEGISDDDPLPEIAHLFEESGFAYGFTGCPDFALPLVTSYPAIALIRDPRDILVSLYYSLRYSHRDPPASVAGQTPAHQTWLAARDRARSVGLDEHVLTYAASYGRVLQSYSALLGHENLKFYRYEDIIYRKADWLSDILDHFQWNVPSRRLKALLAEIDLFPTEENEHSHVRQVHPGNYLKKLQPQTIQRLNELLQQDMAVFGYS
jgi:hypothetical protein